MRRIPTLLRFVGSGCGALTLTLFLSAAVSAQENAAKPAPSAVPLSHYVPRDGLVFYVEFAGLDAHGDAWRKTAAYKMLNETTLGATLENMAAQYFEWLGSQDTERKVTGAELVKIIEHVARHGFVYAANAKAAGASGDSAVVVIRDAASRDVRAMFSRLMISFGGPHAKPEIAKTEAGPQVVLMNGQKPGTRWGWWPEKDDLVIAPNGLADVAVVTELLAGKRPDATDHPSRLELAKADNGMEPIGLAFLDPAHLPTNDVSNALPKPPPLPGATQIDLRWGPSGDALVSVLRIKARKPRQGLLALADQPTFDSKSLPPMPEGITEFSAVGLDGAKAYDSMASLAKIAPAFGSFFDSLNEFLKTKGRLDLRKDVMAHLGPKLVLYTPPASAAATPKAAAPLDAATAPNPLAAVLGSMATLPRYVLLIEVDDAKAFERSLDNLMILANRSIRELAAAAPAPAPAAAGGDGAPADAPPRKQARPNPEFKMMPGQSKSYVLTIPSELGKLPAGLRPTIRVGAKHVAFATSPELARQALEIKPGAAWVPADESAAALEQVSPGLIFLRLEDPREQMPQLLASIPGELQKRINAAIAKSKAPPVAVATGAGAGQPPGAAGGGPYRSSSNSSAGNPGVYAPITSGPDTSSSSPSSSSSGYPGSGQPGAAGATEKGDASLVFRIDPAKLPSASALKALLFPSTTSVIANSEEVRFVRRVAFPDLFVPTSPPFLDSWLAARKKAQETAARNAALSAPAATPAPAGSSTSPSSKSSAGARGESPRE